MKQAYLEAIVQTRKDGQQHCSRRLLIVWERTSTGQRTKWTLQNNFLYGGPKLNTNSFFSNFSGTLDIPPKSQDIPPKSLDFEGHAELFGRHPFHVEDPDPHPTRRYPDQKVWVWVPFPLPDFGRRFLWMTPSLAPLHRVRKISPKFSCIKFFQIRDVPTQIPGHPGHSLSKTTEKGHLHKVFVRDIPTSGSRMSQEYPAQKLYV